jgi:cell division protease FtsH
MVMRFGMSDKLGPRVYGHDHGQPFLGREFSTEPDYSDEIAREIDDEVRRIIEGAHERARAILGEQREHLDRISNILLRRETIEKEQFEKLLTGATEADVFGPDEPDAPALTPDPEPAPERARPETARPLPRPGLAAEMRATEPRRPQLG